MLDPAQNDDGTMFNPLPSTDPKRVARAIAAPPLLTDGGTGGRTEPLGGLSKAPAGLTETSPPSGSLSLSPRFGPGRDASGVITADSAKAAYGNDMQRSGGVFGTMDMAGVNGILERENKARGEMIDLSIKANGGNGVASLPDYTAAENVEKTNRWALDDMVGRMKSAGTRTERAALGQAMNTMIAGQNQMAVEEQRQQGLSNSELARQGLTMRGQDLALQRAQERNDVIARGQDVRADVAGERIASNEAIAGARIAERAGRPEQTGRLTTAQQRSNAEIDAARTAIAGLTPEEIKRKTANFTATGRENPDFDPTLAKSVSQANRRKFGDDQEFDQRQQPQQPAGAADHGYDRKDVAQRFRSERAMDRYKLGNDTPNGVEVLDSAGKVVGHYR